MVHNISPTDFPEIRGPISLPKNYLLDPFGGEIGRVRSRANLTRFGAKKWQFGTHEFHATKTEISSSGSRGETWV